jgi:hypothetical protein
VLRHRLGDVSNARHQSVECQAIDFQHTVGLLQPPAGHGAIHLAALDIPAQSLPEFRFRRAQLVRQTKARLEKTVVYAAQLAD